MTTTFHKMHGLGNDFVLLDLRHQSLVMDASLAIQLSNRHTGIGCDQILILRPPSNDLALADFEFWNVDGNRAEQCGNGVRCIARYLQMNSETPLGKFQLAGVAGLVTIECLDDAMVRVEMGNANICRTAGSGITGTGQWLVPPGYRWTTLPPGRSFNGQPPFIAAGR